MVTEEPCTGQAESVTIGPAGTRCGKDPYRPAGNIVQCKNRKNP